jgi:hypothetical protein
MNRRRLVLSSMTAAGLSLWGAHLQANGNRPAATGVRKAQGDVRINGKPVRTGQMVLPGDTVTTGAGSESVYVMGNSAFLVRENSTVSYSAEALAAVMRVVTGKVLSVFGPGSTRIETPTATVGIRGTGCYIEAQAEQVYFCLCYGAADVVPSGDRAQAMSLVTRYHDTPFYIGADTAKPLIQSAPVINHRDYELTLLENAVGREPPFAGSGKSDYSGGY